MLIPIITTSQMGQKTHLPQPKHCFYARHALLFSLTSGVFSDYSCMFTEVTEQMTKYECSLVTKYLTVAFCVHWIPR